MFLQLNHQKLDVFTVSKDFVLECYRLTKPLPTDEKIDIANEIGYLKKIDLSALGEKMIRCFKLLSGLIK